MRIKDSKKLIEFTSGVARTPKFLRWGLIRNDHTGKLRVGDYEIAEFESPEEENEFFQKLIDGPNAGRARGWRSG